MLRSKLPNYFKNRRDQLMARYEGAAFLFPATASMIRNSDVFYPFRQESCFFYLSGFDEPDSFLVIHPVSGKGYETVLFVQPRDEEKEIWEGERYGLEGAKKVFGVDRAFTIDQLEKELPALLQGSSQVFYRQGLNPESDRQVLQALETHRRSQGRSGKGLLPVFDSHEALAHLRALKRPEEIEALRKSCSITAKAHEVVMRETRPGMNESEIEALINYWFRKQGSQRLAYGSIIASGKNSTCLHYHSNNEELKDGNLLLIDAGGEYDYYASDITRTFPVGKKFTAEQKQVYEIVLKSQKEAIAMVRPGATLPEIHTRVCEILVEELLSAHILKGDVKEILDSKGYRNVYPHGTSHWMGMDVHDVGLYLVSGEPVSLEEGMVFTIEPGLYFQKNDETIPQKYRGIGIRIEDDILVTATGSEVLTAQVPKEVEEIEKLRSC